MRLPNRRSGCRRLGLGSVQRPAKLIASVSLSHRAGKKHIRNPHTPANSPISSIITRINMECLPMISLAFCYGTFKHPPYVYEPESPTPEIVGPPIVPDELVEAWYPKIRFDPKE